MSSTTIKGLRLAGPIDDILELKNSHGSAPVIWDAMSQKYLGTPPYGYQRRIDELWKLSSKSFIAKHLRAVLMMTYDDVIITREHFVRAAADLRAFLVDFPPVEGTVNHLAAIAEVFESTPDYDGVGFHWTSVTEDPFAGEHDEEKDEYAPHDFSKNWSLYHALDQDEKAA